MSHVALRCCVSFVLCLALSACGGGSGGGGDENPAGQFQTVVLEGDPLPGPTVGDVGQLPIGGIDPPRMALAAGGHSAVVVPTTNMSVPWIVLVVDPDGASIEALTAGEAAPGLPTGAIASVERVWITADGVLVAWVTLTGNADGRTFGLVSVTIDGGAADDPVRVIYDRDSLAGAGLAGEIDAIDPDDVAVDDNGRAWFFATGSVTAPCLFSAPSDGTSLSLHVAPGDPLSLGVTVAALTAFGVAPAGDRFAFVADASDATDRLYTGRPGFTTFDRIASSGDGLFGGGSIATLHAGEPLIVYSTNNVAWRAVGSLAANDDVLLYGSPLAGEILARRGGIAAGTAGGTFGLLRLLHQESGTSIPYFAAEVQGAGNGIDVAICGLLSPTAEPELAVYEGRAAPGGGAMGTIFPSVDRPPLFSASRSGSLGFSNELIDGRDGVYWLVPFTGFFKVAVSGEASPLGEDWAPSSFLHVTNAADGIQWQGRLVPSDRDGIFRRVR